MFSGRVGLSIIWRYAILIWRGRRVTVDTSVEVAGGVLAAVDALLPALDGQVAQVPGRRRSGVGVLRGQLDDVLAFARRDPLAGGGAGGEEAAARLRLRVAAVELVLGEFQAAIGDAMSAMDETDADRQAGWHGLQDSGYVPAPVSSSGAGRADPGWVSAEPEQSGLRLRRLDQSRTEYVPLSGGGSLLMMHDLDHVLGMDDEFPWRDPADPFNRVHPMYADEDGLVHPNVRLLEVEFDSERNELTEVLRSGDGRLGGSVEELTSVWPRLEEDVGGIVGRLIELGRTPRDRRGAGGTPRRMAVRRLREQDVRPHEAVLVGQRGGYLVAPDWQPPDGEVGEGPPSPDLRQLPRTELPLLRNGRVVGLYMGGLLQTVEQLERWEATYPQFPRYTMDLVLKSGEPISMGAEGVANSTAFVNTALDPDSGQPDFGRINATYMTFHIRMTDRRGDPHWQAASVLLAFDNAVDDSNPSGMLLVDYGANYGDNFIEEPPRRERRRSGQQLPEVYIKPDPDGPAGEARQGVTAAGGVEAMDVDVVLARREVVGVVSGGVLLADGMFEVAVAGPGAEGALRLVGRGGASDGVAVWDVFRHHDAGVVARGGGLMPGVLGSRRLGELVTAPLGGWEMRWDDGLLGATFLSGQVRARLDELGGLDLLGGSVVLGQELGGRDVVLVRDQSDGMRALVFDAGRASTLLGSLVFSRVDDGFAVRFVRAADAGWARLFEGTAGALRAVVLDGDVLQVGPYAVTVPGMSAQRPSWVPTGVGWELPDVLVLWHRAATGALLVDVGADRLLDELWLTPGELLAFTPVDEVVTSAVSRADRARSGASGRKLEGVVPAEELPSLVEVWRDDDTGGLTVWLRGRHQARSERDSKRNVAAPARGVLLVVHAEAQGMFAYVLDGESAWRRVRFAQLVALLRTVSGGRELLAHACYAAWGGGGALTALLSSALGMRTSGPVGRTFELKYTGHVYSTSDLRLPATMIGSGWPTRPDSEEGYLSTPDEPAPTVMTEGSFWNTATPVDLMLDVLWGGSGVWLLPDAAGRGGPGWLARPPVGVHLADVIEVFVQGPPTPGREVLVEAEEAHSDVRTMTHVRGRHVATSVADSVGGGGLPVVRVHSVAQDGRVVRVNPQQPVVGPVPIVVAVDMARRTGGLVLFADGLSDVSRGEVELVAPSAGDGAGGVRTRLWHGVWPVPDSGGRLLFVTQVGAGAGHGFAFLSPDTPARRLHELNRITPVADTVDLIVDGTLTADGLLRVYDPDGEPFGISAAHLAALVPSEVDVRLVPVSEPDERLERFAAALRVARGGENVVWLVAGPVTVDDRGRLVAGGKAAMGLQPDLGGTPARPEMMYIASELTPDQVAVRGLAAGQQAVVAHPQAPAEDVYQALAALPGRYVYVTPAPPAVLAETSRPRRALRERPTQHTRAVSVRMPDRVDARMVLGSFPPRRRSHGRVEVIGFHSLPGFRGVVGGLPLLPTHLHGQYLQHSVRVDADTTILLPPWRIDELAAAGYRLDQAPAVPEDGWRVVAQADGTTGDGVRLWLTNGNVVNLSAAEFGRWLHQHPDRADRPVNILLIPDRDGSTPDGGRQVEEGRAVLQWRLHTAGRLPAVTVNVTGPRPTASIRDGAGPPAAAGPLQQSSMTAVATHAPLAADVVVDAVVPVVPFVYRGADGGPQRRVDEFGDAGSGSDDTRSDSSDGSQYEGSATDSGDVMDLDDVLDGDDAVDSDDVVDPDLAMDVDGPGESGAGSPPAAVAPMAGRRGGGWVRSGVSGGTRRGGVSRGVVLRVAVLTGREPTRLQFEELLELGWRVDHGVGRGRDVLFDALIGQAPERVRAVLESAGVEAGAPLTADRVRAVVADLLPELSAASPVLFGLVVGGATVEEVAERLRGGSGGDVVRAWVLPLLVNGLFGVRVSVLQLDGVMVTVGPEEGPHVRVMRVAGPAGQFVALADGLQPRPERYAPVSSMPGVGLPGGGLAGLVDAGIMVATAMIRREVYERAYAEAQREADEYLTMLESYRRGDFDDQANLNVLYQLVAARVLTTSMGALLASVGLGQAMTLAGQEVQAAWDVLPDWVHGEAVLGPDVSADVSGLVENAGLWAYVDAIDNLEGQLGEDPTLQRLQAAIARGDRAVLIEIQDDVLAGVQPAELARSAHEAITATQLARARDNAAVQIQAAARIVRHTLDRAGARSMPPGDARTGVAGSVRPESTAWLRGAFPGRRDLADEIETQVRQDRLQLVDRSAVEEFGLVGDGGSVYSIQVSDGGADHTVLALLLPMMDRPGLSRLAAVSIEGVVREPAAADLVELAGDFSPKYFHRLHLLPEADRQLLRWFEANAHLRGSKVLKVVFQIVLLIRFGRWLKDIRPEVGGLAGLIGRGVNTPDPELEDYMRDASPKYKGRGWLWTDADKALTRLKHDVKALRAGHANPARRLGAPDRESKAIESLKDKYDNPNTRRDGMAALWRLSGWLIRNGYPRGVAEVTQWTGAAKDHPGVHAYLEAKDWLPRPTRSRKMAEARLRRLLRCCGDRPLGRYSGRSNV